ncbi:DUF2069 domain-containing protein [Dyella sedimenti]|uniref:DUF2069 domain-containing protein n=1 Tax=Dyella sedimenti TaxID=2919947 RepID=UPI001FA9D595|nr:DUF2069 domain-containing protein [Dyella sedimenti]
MSAPLAAPYRVGLAAWAALALLQLAWHGWLFPAQQLPAPLVLAITVIPLLLPLLALRNVRRALLWVGILSLFYFCHGVSEAWSAPDERWLAWLEIAFTLALIGTLGWGVRHKSAA